MGFFDKLKQGLSKTKSSFDEKLNNVFSNFRKVDEELLDELEEALIMSDVGVETSNKIITNLRNKIKKEKIEDEQAVRQALRDEIKNVLEEVDNTLKLETTPSVILVVGVNGVGKTTSIGKIANRLKQDGKKVVVAAADTFRAAAVEQLEIWANRAGCDIVKREEGTDPAAVVYDAVKIAKEKQADVLICDTAGRLHNKKYLMDELVKIKKVIDKELPEASKEVLMVLDATTGQNAISQVTAFKETVNITGLVLTKLDGDTRGGAALSIRAVSGKPILYVGMGEKLSDLEQFYPDRMASRILGMGDVMSLIEKAQANIDEEKAKAMEQKMKKAQFDFNDYLDSMEQMRNMGGISSILNMLPGVGAKMKGQDLESMVDEKDMARKEAIVLSMTPKERETPDLINPSRKQRIAKGAGVDIAEVNRFIKQFEQSRKMMKQMTGMVGKGGKRGGFKLPF